MYKRTRAYIVVHTVVCNDISLFTVNYSLHIQKSNEQKSYDFNFEITEALSALTLFNLF